MADNFSQFYSGNMAPPLKLPGGGYAPAPYVSAQMSPEEFYEGIYGEPLGGLSSRSAKTVPINPSTGMPYATTATASMQGGGGIAAGGRGDVRYSPPVYQPNGTTVPNKDTSRLPALPVGLPLKTDVPGFASARGSLGAGGFGNGSVTMSPRFPSAAAPDDGVIDLSSLEMSERGAQNTADSEGKPVRTKSGKVYYPGGKAPAGNVSASLGARDTRGPLGQMLGLKGSGGLGGLLGGLFGGGGQQSRGGGLGGLLSGMGGGAQATRAPLAGHSMIVDPSTQAGSTLESMGFSSGGSVPAAVVENLSKRGYI